MTHAPTPDGEPRTVPADVEVWNRATSGIPFSTRPGDVALAHALRFDGYAGAGSVLGGLEMEIGENCVGEGRAGFAHFGLQHVVDILDEGVEALAELERSSVEGDEHADLYDAHDRALSARYDDVTDALTAALVEALATHPEDFAPTTGHEVEPVIVDENEPVAVGFDPQVRRPYAVDIAPEDKAERSAAVLQALGIESSWEGRYVSVAPRDDAEWALVDEVFALLEHRYPERSR